MATDFRSGKDFPRRGRTKLGEFYWLARVFDKGRAKRDDTIFDYIYPCPLDKRRVRTLGHHARPTSTKR